MNATKTSKRSAMDRAKNRLEDSDLAVIKQQANLLAKTAHASRDEAREYEQEVCYRWLVAPATFDASKGSREAYVKTFARREIAKMRRDRRAQKRDPLRCGSLNIPVSIDDEQSSELAQQIGKDARRLDAGRDDPDLRLDVAAALEVLPEAQRELAVFLMHKSVAETAANRNVPRSSLERQVEQLGRALRRSGLQKSWWNSA